MVDTTTFENELNTDLIAELAASGVEITEAVEKVLSVKIKAVVRELLNIRNYKYSGMTDEEVEADIDQFYTQCINVARYDYNQLGAEGEETHNENGISRKYIDRGKLWTGVVPFAKV